MAAPIITCPACTKKFKGKEGIEGKRIKCPLCATPFVVPAGASSQVKAAPAAAAPASDGLRPEEAATPMENSEQRVSWDPADENSNPYDLGTFDERYRCPNCANPMESAKAVICLTCGYNTLTREWGSTVKTMGITGGQHIAHLLPGIFFLFLLITFVVAILFFALELPPLIVNSWASFLDHESMRMWINMLALAFMWVFGMLAFRRLVLSPKPAEVKKD